MLNVNMTVEKCCLMTLTFVCDNLLFILLVLSYSKEYSLKPRSRFTSDSAARKPAPHADARRRALSCMFYSRVLPLASDIGEC